MANEKEIKDLEKQVKEKEKEIKSLEKKILKSKEQEVNAFTYTPGIASMDKPLPEVSSTSEREKESKFKPIYKQIGILAREQLELNRQIDELSKPKQINLETVNAEIDRLNRRSEALEAKYIQYPQSFNPEQLPEVTDVAEEDKRRIGEQIVTLIEKRTEIENQINTLKTQIENNKNSIRTMPELVKYYKDQISTLSKQIASYETQKRNGLSSEEISYFDNIHTMRMKKQSFEDRLNELPQRKKDLRHENADLTKKIKELEGKKTRPSKDER